MENMENNTFSDTQNVLNDEVVRDEPQQTQSEQVTQEEAVKTAIANGETQEAQPWTPSYKVKAYDKEHEIPENFRPFINQENEKDFKDIFEKAFALETIKGKYQKTKEIYEKVNNDYTTVSKELGKPSKYIQNGDFDSYFSYLGIDDAALQKWMYQKLTISELSPEQQALYHKNQEALKKQYELEQQNSELKVQADEYNQIKTEQAIAKRSQELDTELARPDIASISRNFDSKAGKQGAFREEVINRASFLVQQSGKDISAKDAVAEVLRLVAWDKQITGDKVLPTKAGDKPTLPSLQGKASSPVAQKIKSLDDLRKLKSQITNGAQ